MLAATAAGSLWFVFFLHLKRGGVGTPPPPEKKHYLSYLAFPSS